MKTVFKIILLLFVNLSLGQTVEEKYEEAFFYMEYNHALQEFFNKIITIKPLKSTGDDNKILHYTVQPSSDFIITQITYRIIGTLPDDNLERNGSIERVGIVDLLGTHQYKPRKYTIFLDSYDEKLDQRKVSDAPVSWKEMDMELDIISMTFQRNSGGSKTKFIKYKRSLAKPRLQHLLSNNPGLKEIEITEEHKNIIEEISPFKITKETNYAHRRFDCSYTDLETLKLPRIWSDKYLTGAMYSLPDCISSFKKLKVISFPKHEIDKIPESLASITTLEAIDLPKNKLSCLPENLGNFKSLKYLNVADNLITEIPTSIGLLEKITSIDLSNNYLSEIPKEMYQLKSLKKLNLDGNQIPKKEIEKLKKKLKNCEILD